MNKIIQLYLDNAKRDKQVVNMVRNGAEATIYIYDMIDPYWGVSAKAVIADIAQAGDAEVLHVRINSPGGSVFESRAIIEAIKRFPGKTIGHIDSLAASAATSISLACDEVEISDGGFFMIHNASGMAWGDKSDLRETADLLEKVEGVIAAEYAAESGQELAQIVSWMEAETWFTASEAIAAGFIDRIATSAKATTNCWNLAAFSKAPKALLQPAPETPAAPAAAAPATPAAAPSMSQTNANRLALIQAL
jgi:ATP-dependent Clp protease protease subunit